MRAAALFLNISLLSCLVSAQSYTVSTFAGGALTTNIPSPSVKLTGGGGLAVDADGNLFFGSGNTVFRLDAHSGLVSPIAGNGTPGYSGDNGPAINAQLNSPAGIAVDSAGNLYIADAGNNRVRRVFQGVIETFAGTGPAGQQFFNFSGDDGPATNALLSAPLGVAVSSAGDVFIADWANGRIRKVSNGVISTVAMVADPKALAVDSSGHLYIANTLYDEILKLSNGTSAIFAGVGSNLVDNGPFPCKFPYQLYYPGGIAVDSAGSVYISDTVNQRVRKVSNGAITTIAGLGSAGFSGDNGSAISAQMDFPGSLAVDSAGNVFIADSENYRIRKVSNGTITSVVGGGSIVMGSAGFSGDGGSPVNAQLNGPAGIATDGAANLFIADTGNNRIREVSNGVITGVAGSGNNPFGGFSGDNGPATSAELKLPFGVAVDSIGNLYVADSSNNRVRKVSNGVITTEAGNGTFGFGGDNGPATNAQLYAPMGVAVDSVGSLYIADTQNNRIRKVSNGVITTVAGNGAPGFSGDSGPGAGAQLCFPEGVAVDIADNLYIADSCNGRIRKVSGGIITTIVGNGTPSFGGDNGPAISAQLSGPVSIALDPAGNLYIADTYNNRIRKVSNGVITTIAGNGTQSFGGDNGPALLGQLDQPFGIAVDSSGNVYFTDGANSRVRVLTPSATIVQLPSIAAVANAASNVSGPVAPGEIVVLTGSRLGPPQLTSASVGGDGLYDTQLASVSVRFSGIPARMIYASATQVAAIVPYEIGAPSVEVTVSNGELTSVPMTVPVSASAPGIFTLDSTGRGQAAAVNHDGSINGAAAPAKPGDFILLFATGEGQTFPDGVDGKPAVQPLPAPLLPVTVSIGGQTVQPEYAGGAPEEVAGVMQVNVEIPTDITPSSAVPVAITVGGIASQTGVTIAVGP
jgi:uncharacterized protein (TIGR03437 family)